MASARAVDRWAGAAGAAGAGVSTPRRSGTVLLVDDSEDDQELALLALRTLPQRLHVSVACDGVEALARLRESPRSTDLVLLDFKMPRLDGVGVLRERLADPALRRIPVVVFSTSAAAWDVGQCYDLGANAYLRKPSDVGVLERVLGDVVQVFLNHIEPPGGLGEARI